MAGSGDSEGRVVSQEQSEQRAQSEHSERRCRRLEGWRVRVRVSVRASVSASVRVRVRLRVRVKVRVGSYNTYYLPLCTLCTPAGASPILTLLPLLTLHTYCTYRLVPLAQRHRL